MIIYALSFGVLFLMEISLKKFFLVHCFFSEWGSWSKCSHSCGNSQGAGTRIRNRYIAVEAKHGGMKCYGNLKELDSCIHCAKKPKGYDGPCINFCPGKILLLAKCIYRSKDCSDKVLL